MDDGLYLSSYITPPGLANHIGWWTRHDNNFSVWRKTGRRIDLLGHWEFERFANEKHFGLGAPSGQMLTEFVAELLSEIGVKFDEILDFWGTPGLGRAKRAVTFAQGSGLPIHALSHLYASVLMDSAIFRSSPILGLAPDGRPDLVLETRRPESMFAGGVLQAGKLATFPIMSPGPLFRRAKDSFCLEEGTLMALTTASTATVLRPFALDPVLDGAQLRGKRSGNQAERVIRSVREHVTRVGWTADDRFSDTDNLISAVMKCVQSIAVGIMESNIDSAIDRFGLNPKNTFLALGGGFALNCPANSYLMEKYGFGGLLAPPYVNDAGQSIGLALGMFYEHLGVDFEFKLPSAYLGSELSGLRRDLDAYEPYIADVQDLQADVVVADLIREPIAWLDGRAESGPRALGHRSILSDPRSLEAKERCNTIKQRQWWRPVAPVVLEERTDEWFELSRPSPYMLETFQVRPEKAHLVPAIAHLDGSARIQTVSKQDDPGLHALLRTFESRTGIPMLCNTSLNDKGEPIINTAAQAFNFCLRKGLAVAYVQGKRVEFRTDEPIAFKAPLDRVIGWTAGEIAATEELGEPELDDLYVFVYLENPELRAAYDIRTPQGVRGLRAAIDLIFASDPDSKALAESTLARRGMPM